MDNNNNEGNHKFTPKSLLSSFTITRIILELTSGEIKSRAGFDNTDVIKGHDNFENMQSMVDNLASIIAENGAIQLATDLKKDIDKIENFYKLDFSRLGIGTSVCTCLKCGFHHPDDDPIECCIHHGPSCLDCQKTFKVRFISFIHNMLHEYLLTNYTGGI